MARGVPRAEPVGRRLGASAAKFARFEPKRFALNGRHPKVDGERYKVFSVRSAQLPRIGQSTVPGRRGKALVHLRGDLHFLQASLAADYAKRLRAAGLRVTRPRIAVLYAVHKVPHSEADSIIRAVHDCARDVSRQAVYDSLHTLTSAGLLRRMQPSGFVARYESRVGDNHHHMVCRLCGTIADVDCAVGAAPCLTASDAGGFQLDEAEVIYWGRCPECSEPEAPEAISDCETTRAFRDGVRFGRDARPVTPSIPSTAAVVGTRSAHPPNAVLISFDLASAALTGYGRPKGQSLPAGAAEETQ